MLPHELMPFVSLVPEPSFELLPPKFRTGEVVKIISPRRVGMVKSSKLKGEEYYYCVITNYGQMCNIEQDNLIRRE